MKFQLKYLGESCLDPETLTTDSLESAIQTARRRLQQAGATGVALMSEGFVVRTLKQTDSLPETLDDQILANAGIYRFGAPRLDG